MALVGEQIPGYVQKQIEVRQKAHGSGTSSDLLRTDETLIYTNSRNAFIKMASGVSVSEAKLKEIGYSGADLDILKGMGLAKNHVLFGGISYMSQIANSSGGTDGVLFQKSDFIGINGAYTADPDFGIVPMPGVESLEVKSLNRGSLKKATVKLTAQTRNQLAVLDLLYMRLGYTVLIEWGNSIYLDKNGKLQKMYTSIIEDNKLWFNPTWSSKRSFADITGQISKVRELYDGNFDALLGKVSNFNWSFNSDGSYSIELTIISLGDIVESLKVNVPAAYNTMKFVNDNGTAWLTEDDTLDQHRKDNIVLSLLHTLRVLNQNPTGTKITISTKDTSGVDQPIAYPGRLLTIGGNVITTSDHQLTLTYTVGWKNDETGQFISPDDLKEGYYGLFGVAARQLTFDEAKKLASTNTEANGDPEYYKGYGYDVQEIGGGIERARLVFKSKRTANIFTETKTFSDIEWKDYIDSGDQSKNYKDLSKSENPVSKFRYEFFTKYSDFDFDKTKENFLSIALFSDTTQEVLRTTPKEKKLSLIEVDTRPIQNKISISFAQVPNRSTQSINAQNISNPLKGTGYEDDDAFVLNLDKPQYYIRFGYLLDLLKKKVVTRINTGKKNYDENPNIFNIDTDENNSLMLCLPQQISFDWRTCIVRRNQFDRPNSWQQKIFPQLRQWYRPDTNTAFALNVYLNFNFIAESMTSNSDDRGNISVYDFIKSMCDGINKAMGGINNLEPVIDEDTNTLRIFESSPIPKEPVNPGYKLQLYGYGNGVTSPKNSSTFVRKVDLKTAITPEYATMITVGATANGYVKGTEATAFARWNSGLTDRFKSELLAADSETKLKGDDDRDDTAANFQAAMNWTARCFGIEGAGKIWECFPQ